MTRLAIVVVADSDIALSATLGRLAGVCPAATEVWVAGTSLGHGSASAVKALAREQVEVRSTGGRATTAGDRRAEALEHATADAVWLLEGDEGLAHADAATALNALAKDSALDASAAAWIEQKPTADVPPRFGVWPRGDLKAALGARLVPPLSALVWRRSALERVVAAGGLAPLPPQPAGRRLAAVAAELDVRVADRPGAYVALPMRDHARLPDPDRDDAPTGSLSRFVPRFTRVRLELDRCDARLDDGRSLPLDAHEAALTAAIVEIAERRPRTLAGWVMVALAERHLPVDLAPAWVRAAQRLLARGAFRDGGGA